ncbi:MAG: plasmid partitioning protein RepB [Boseongicola sp. SB0664_bin_43]|uniref:Plasmid partitioning protein RepB n=1 Tax=Boseongicola sp. SB0664_bin_43 TaxID=2604844 RepID=A0A6B0Y0P1_9RHOB|nr:plasmid partitioning protein RepB [Boseongicola sp. SB0664_bin_43]
MTKTRESRKSMLDNLVKPVPAPEPRPTSMIASNLALRAARDAVDGHQVWELDPADIVDDRMTDRLDAADIADLRASIEANGQSVPILVRRDPEKTGRYRLIYGRRRLEAVRVSENVQMVRALVANLDDGEALQAQVTENTARRDLSFIERALFAQELVENGLGHQSHVADLLNMPKSTVSTAIRIADTVGIDLAREIGPALGIGRPRWEALAKCIATGSVSPEELIEVAAGAKRKANAENSDKVSVAAFEAVARHAASAGSPPRDARPRPRRIKLGGTAAASVRSTAKGVRIDIEARDRGFAAWVEVEADSNLKELHERWRQRSEV